MSENDELKLKKGPERNIAAETKTISALSVEGEIPCIVVHSDQSHVQGINHIINPLTQLLPQKGFKPTFLSDEVKPLQQYGRTFEQLAEDCALGIVILDGLRPNVLLEFGILLGKKKPIIPLQDKSATVALKSFYQKDYRKSGLTSQQFNRDLKEPSLGSFFHISDLQGLHVEKVNKDASICDPEYPAAVIDKSIEKLRSEIIEEYKKRSLEPIAEINPTYLQQFHEVVLKISEYYSGRKEFSAEYIEEVIKEVENLEKEASTHMPSGIYSMIASLYISLSEKTEWKNIPTIIDYYNQSMRIFERILKFEPDATLKSQTKKKIGDIYWDLSQYQHKAENCNKAIRAYKEALKVYTLDRFPMDYAMTQNNLGNAYSTLAEVEAKAENCKKAIRAYREALKVYTLDRFPMQYAMTQNNLGTAYGTLAQVEAKAENCKKAIKACEEALKVYTLACFPMDYAGTQNNLGAAYSTLAEVEAKAENCKKAIKACEEALKVFTKEDFPEIFPLVEHNIIGLLKFCKEE